MKDSEQACALRSQPVNTLQYEMWDLWRVLRVCEACFCRATRDADLVDALQDLGVL